MVSSSTNCILEDWDASCVYLGNKHLETLLFDA